MEELTIYLEDTRKVKELEATVAQLREELATVREELRQVSFQFRCESVVSQELADLCRAHGVNMRPALEKRPW